jgi:flagellar basal-body rod protein FlgF
MESLEMLANNLANAATAGYKGDREFYSLYLAPEASAPSGASLETLPVIERKWTDHSQGSLLTTGNPLDLALYGRGFFAVNGPATTLYTRDGSFRLSATGELATAAGYAVRAAGGGTIQATYSGPIEVSADGTVSQDGTVLGRLELVDFQDPAALDKQGGSYFRAQAGATPVVNAEVEVRQGKLESSNVAPAEGAVRLVSVMRQFEMLQKAINIGAEMNRKAIEEVARLG